MPWWLKKKNLSLLSTTIVLLLAVISFVITELPSFKLQTGALASPFPLPSTTTVLGVTENNLLPITPTGATTSATITKIVDGDTVKLNTGQTLRYIGIDTPETKDPRREVGCFGHEATLKNTELVLNQTVVLEKDVSETDRYGRLLRYVYLDGVLINELLISEGFATASEFPPDIKYAERLKLAETVARQAQRGLWSDICQTAL